MEFTCEHAGPLVSSYLDNELSEAQAAPLRQHLLGCPACRELAKQGKVLSAWFAGDTPPVAPPGFAARVARRAFAGDTGDSLAPTPVTAGEGSLLSFTLRLTAAAAVTLLGLSLAISFASRPDTGGRLGAEEINEVLRDEYMRHELPLPDEVPGPEAAAPESNDPESPADDDGE